MHGADYNPEQWLNYPEILQRDIEMMKQAGCNVMSLAIFGWSTLEPMEGVFNFNWLENVIDNLYGNGIYTILATPSAARPAWLARKYPEVLRVNDNLDRISMGNRHNHCYTSPIYREKTAVINRKLAERFSQHPGVILWHLSNEYGGYCYCPLCQEAFRQWLKQKYKTLDNLNHAWWTTFWSHTYTEWEQIEAPVKLGENSINGLLIDWRRFSSEQTIDFIKAEANAVKAVNPDIPVTTNLMSHDMINYFHMRHVLDIVSWDAYPEWHEKDSDLKPALETSFIFDIMRGIKRKPFLLMESTPSMTNWRKVCKGKRPNFHILSSLLPVAHGSNSVQYFQWRKSRGSCEQFHGAVVDHYGGTDDRVFQEVAELGRILKMFPEITQTNVKSDICFILDWENRWAIDSAKAIRNFDKGYMKLINEHYSAFRKAGIMTDVTDMEGDISGYKLVVAPMLFMLRAGFAEKIREFVKNGGIAVVTFWTGVVDESGLCFLGGTPYSLTDVFGVRSKELESGGDGDFNEIKPVNNGSAFFDGSYECSRQFDILQISTAEVLMEYQHDFYKNTPSLTVNNYGKGKAYYIATAPDGRFYADFYGHLLKELDISESGVAAPEGVLVSNRENGDYHYLFILNFNNFNSEVTINQEAEILYGVFNGGCTIKNIKINIEAYGVIIAKIKK